MAADYAGALAAIRAYFEQAWVTNGSPTTPVAFANEASQPAVGSDGNPTTWVFFEVLSSGSSIEGLGTTGNNTVVYRGLIVAHVFAPINTGLDDPLNKAVAIGEIFRNKLFYDNVTSGCFVRSGYDIQGQPRVSQGDASSDDGQWFAVTATIPFEFWCRR